MNLISKILGVLQFTIWGFPLILLIMGVGIFFSCKTGFFQITRFGCILKSTCFSAFREKKTANLKDMSPFKAACTALSATIGTGNITGVATAITLGGPGAIFWMWVSSFFGMMTAFGENLLGGYYRKIEGDNTLSGGAMFYLEKGLSKGKLAKFSKPLAISFAFFCLLASFGMGNMTQSNTAVNILTPKGDGALIFALILTLIVGIIMSGGTERISDVSGKLLPFMAALYILGTTVLIVINFSALPTVFSSIFKTAFGIEPILGGFSGNILRKGISTGVKRGVFSNEAGLGSAVIVNASSKTAEPVEIGMWGIFEVFFDTTVICTLTALALLSGGCIDLDTGMAYSGTTGAVLVGLTFGSAFGEIGNLFIMFSTIFFAISTTVGWSFFGIKCAEYLFGEKGGSAYKILFTAATFLGGIMKLEIVWQISDIFNGLMALPNLIGVIALRKEILAVYENYRLRRFKNKNYLVPILAKDKRVQKLLLIKEF